MLKSKQINYNGELDGFHVHKTVEIRAPYGNYVSVTVEDFNIGNKTIEMGGKEDDDLCGYGSIFIFAGQGSINQMIKVVEFCGSKDSPIIDYQNKNYLGIQGENFSEFSRFLRFRRSIQIRSKTRYYKSHLWMAELRHYSEITEIFRNFEKFSDHFVHDQ